LNASGNWPKHYGSATFAGDTFINAGTSDGSATFAGTVTANGTILNRAGGVTLDVGDRLEKVDAALQALKTAAAAASDFAALKSAIATALANI
jgi:surface antigen